MLWLFILVLAVILVPIMAILIDSPIGRALARRLEGPVDVAPPPLVDLARKVQLLESEVDDLRSSVGQLQEQNQFLQKLLEEGPRRPPLPPGSAT